MGDAAEQSQPSAGRLMTFALCSCGIAVSLMQTLVLPLLPAFPRLLGVSASEASWLVTATLLAGAASAPVFCRLGDLCGRRRILVVALGVMLTGSILGALSWSYTPLVVARALQGAAFGVLPLGISLLKDHMPADRAGIGVAMMSSTLGIGGALGLPLSGILGQLADWHTVFWVAAGMSLVAMLLAWLCVRESPIRAHGRFDVIGALGLSATLISLLVGISRGAAWGWASGRTIAAFAAAAGLFLGWVAHELRTHAPLINVRASIRPAVLLANLAAVLMGMSVFTSFVLIGQLLQAPPTTGYGHGVPVLVAGLCMAPLGLMMLVFAPMSARLSDAQGAATTLLVGCVVLVIGNLAQAILPSSTAVVTAVLALTAIGTALTYSAMPLIIMAETVETDTAAANGLNAVMRTIGTATCSATAGALLVTYTTRIDGQTLPAGSAYTAAFLIAAAAALLAAILAATLVLMHRRKSTPTTEQPEAALAATH